MEEHRAHRVAEILREELGELIAFELSDPRVNAVDVTGVRISPDSKVAHVRVALRGEAEERKNTMLGLDHAKNFLRRELAVRLSLRRIPELHFEADLDGQDAGRLDILLKRVKKSRKSSQNQP
jgi:ribosome-binding factor A